MIESKHDSWLLPVSFVIVYVVWGTTYLANAWGVDIIPPFLLAGIRFLVAGSVLLIVSSFFNSIKITEAQFKNLFFAGFLLFGIGNGVVTWALQHVNSGITALIIALEPLLVAMLLWSWKKQKPQISTWIGITLGIIGAMVLFGQPEFVSSWNWVLGVIAIFTAMFTWAYISCLLYTSPSPRDATLSRMPSSA